MIEVTNYVEVIVKQHLNRLLKNSEGCDCPRCMADMMALALNNLKPRYVTSENGILMSKLNSIHQQEETDVIVQVTKAIEKVQSNPRHDKL